MTLFWVVAVCKTRTKFQMSNFEIHGSIGVPKFNNFRNARAQNFDHQASLSSNMKIREGLKISKFYSKDFLSILYYLKEVYLFLIG